MRRTGSVLWEIGEAGGPALVDAARGQKMDLMRRIGLLKEVPVEDGLKETGRAPINTNWVDVNKGSEECPNVRCRLVARDLKPKAEDRPDTFGAMPPLEAKKMLFRKAALGVLECRDERWQRRQLIFADIKKAQVNGRLKEDDVEFINCPGGWRDQCKCGKLKRWLYGMRPAEGAWEHEILVQAGVRDDEGDFARTVFRVVDNDIRCVMHGDDLTILGWQSYLGDAVTPPRQHNELKVVHGVQPGRRTTARSPRAR